MIGYNGSGKTTFFKMILCMDSDYSEKIEVKMKTAFLLNEIKEAKMSSPSEYQQL